MVRAGVMTKEAAEIAKKHFAEAKIAKNKLAEAEAEAPALDPGPPPVGEGA